MLKLIGCISVFLPCVFIGFLRAQRLKKRCDSLLALRLALERLGVEISFTKKRLERIFTELSREFKLPVFFDTAVAFKSKGLKDAWHDSLLKYVDDMALTASDIKALAGIGDLSSFAGAEQQKCISTLLRLLELYEQSAQEAYSRTGKLSRSTGALVGLLAVILLF